MKDNNNNKFMIKEDEALGEVLSNAMKESKMGDCLSMEDIASLVDGYVSEEDRERIMKHLSSCGDCYETFLLSSQIKETKWKKRRLVLHPIGLAASVIIVAFLAFLVYKSGFFPKSEVEMEKKPEISADYSIPKEEFKTTADKEHIEKKEIKKLEREKETIGETLRFKSERKEPGSVHKKGEIIDKKGAEAGVKREKMGKSGEYKGYKKWERKGKMKKIEKLNERPDAFKKSDRSVSTIEKNEVPPKSIMEQQVQPKVTQKTTSDELGAEQKEKVVQEDYSRDAVPAIAAGITGEQERSKLLLSSSGLHLYCAGIEGDVSTQFLEHQSLKPLIKKQPVQVKGFLPDKQTFTQDNQEGMVVIEVEIDQKGNVKRACALKGEAGQVRRTVEEILKWKYEPVKIDGKPSPVRFIININYK